MGSKSTDYVFVIFQEMPWESPPQPQHSLARIFLRHIPIVWISTETRVGLTGVYTLLNKFLKDVQVALKVVISKKARSRTSERTFFNPTVVSLPFVHKVRLIWKLNGTFVRFQVGIINHLIHLLFKGKKVILWIYSPNEYLLANPIKAEFLIYHILDDRIAKHPWQLGLERTIQVEKEILENTDIVFACNEEIAGRAKQWNRNTFIGKNGVNFADYERAKIAGAVPEQLSRIRRPIIGYVGTVDSRNDYALLAEVAGKRPDWSFVLLGLITYREAVRSLSGENVHFLGLVDYRELPAYVLSFDVCINFPVISQLTEHADYLKLYEYLAAGKPVVSTDVYAARKVRPLVRIAVDAEDFIRKIEASLADRDTKSIEDRLKFAKDNSWEKRAEDMMAVINDCICNNPTRLEPAAQ